MVESNSFPIYQGNCFKAGLYGTDIFYVEISGEIPFTTHDASELLETGWKLSDGKRMCNLFVVEKTMLPNEEVISFITSPGVSDFTIAQAFVIGSLPQRLLGNFLIRFKSPKYPMKLFNNVDAAIIWLRLHQSEVTNENS